MKPEELEVGKTYFFVKYGTSYDAIYQGTLVGRSESAQKGYIFLTEGTKVQVLWPFDLPMVSADLAQTYFHLAKHYEEQAQKYHSLYQKSLQTNPNQYE